MTRTGFSRFRSIISIAVLASFIAGCTTKATTRFYGQTAAPADNTLRYISGSEFESLDPPVTNSQVDARMLIALYDALVEYHPKTMDPIPGIAESWEVSQDGTEYLFHLRKNARFSNSEAITANDFVYSIRRGFSPELASRNASLGYYIKYAEAYNAGRVFVKDAKGEFLLRKDFEERPPATAGDDFGPATEFHKFIDAPERLTLPADEKERAKLTEKDEKLATALKGKEFIPVKAEDIGVEAIDDYTLRIKLYQPAPYFLGILAHQFFRVVNRNTIEKFGNNWTRPENIVTSGSFKLAEHRPYDKMVIEKDPMNWDAANVKLDRIEFYPLEETTTMMNIYKSGRVDALYNHTVPAAWNELIRQYKDEYLLFPEGATEFYVINIKKPPMDNIKVRQAFALAIDRDALATFRKTIKPLVDLTPEGIFPAYEEARTRVYTAELKKQGSSLEEWKARKFNAEKARKLLTEAGFAVQQTGSGWACPDFPVEKISITYNTAESNKAVAEFVQAQWKQNLGIEVPLKNMEFRTFLPLLNKVEYEGFARRGWVGDYMDPYTFLNLYYSPSNEGGTGWWDPKYDKMLDDANNTVDPTARLEKLAMAELYVSQQQIIIPLSTTGTSWMKKPYVKGMFPNAGTLHAWKFIYIERDPAKWENDVENIMTHPDPIFDAQIAQIEASQKEREKSKAAATPAKTE